MSAPNSTTHAVRSKRGCDRLHNTTRTCTCLRDAEAHIGIIVYEAAGDILQPFVMYRLTVVPTQNIASYATCALSLVYPC